MKTWDIILNIFFLSSLNECRLILPDLTDKSKVQIICKEKSKEHGNIIIKKVTFKNCRCSGLIAERSYHGKLVYRLYYGCSFFKTRKEIFSYCSQGALIGVLTYESIIEEEVMIYDAKLSNADRYILNKVDSLISIQAKEFWKLPLCKKEILGFRSISVKRQKSID